MRIETILGLVVSGGLTAKQAVDALLGEETQVVKTKTGAIPVAGMQKLFKLQSDPGKWEKTRPKLVKAQAKIKSAGLKMHSRPDDLYNSAAGAKIRKYHRGTSDAIGFMLSKH